LNTTIAQLKRSAPALVLAAILSFLPTFAQESPAGMEAGGEGAAPQEPARRWSDSAEFSYVILSGNSSASTLGAKNTYEWTDEISTFTLKARGIRAESERKDERRAVGTVNDFRVVEGKNEVTAENYAVEGRYEHTLSERAFWYSGVSWERDRFKGIQNRYVGAAGIGTLWVDTERATFKTEYAATFTSEDEVVDDPETDDSFAGVRLSSSFARRFAASSEYTNDTVFDGNVDESSDWRASMINAVSVSINDRLKLKVSLEWLYENEPASEELNLFDGAGNPLGQTVLAELDELDTIFTTALVFDF